MATRHNVRNIDLDEVSKVDRPANGLSRFVLFKGLVDRLFKGKKGSKTPITDPEEDEIVEGDEVEGDEDPDAAMEDEEVENTAKSKTRKRATEALPALVGTLQESLTTIMLHGADDTSALLDESIAQFRKALAALPATVDALPSVTPDSGDPDMDPKYIAKMEAELRKRGVNPADLADDGSDDGSDDGADGVVSLPAVIEKRLAALEADRVELAKMKDELRHRDLVSKATLLKAGAPVQDETIIKVVGQLDEEGQTALGTILKQFGELSMISDVFKEFGTSGAEDAVADPEAALEKIATDFRKAEPTLTKHQALAKAYAARPDLYELVDASDDVALTN